MEIVNANAGLLSNHEVLEILRTPHMARYDSYDTFQKKVAALRKKADMKMADAKAPVKGKDDKKGQKPQPVTPTTPAAAGAKGSAPGKVDDPNAPSHEKLMSGKELRDLQLLENTIWVKDRVMSYLSKQPAGTQSDRSVERFLRALRRQLAEQISPPRAELTVGEQLQLMNVRPTSLVGIHKIIEECDERLSDDTQTKLLALIAQHLPKPEGDAALDPDVMARLAAARDAEAETDAEHDARLTREQHEDVKWLRELRAQQREQLLAGKNGAAAAAAAAAVTAGADGGAGDADGDAAAGAADGAAAMGDDGGAQVPGAADGNGHGSAVASGSTAGAANAAGDGSGAGAGGAAKNGAAAAAAAAAAAMEDDDSGWHVTDKKTLAAAAASRGKPAAADADADADDAPGTARGRKAKSPAAKGKGKGKGKKGKAAAAAAAAAAAGDDASGAAMADDGDGGAKRGRKKKVISED